MKTETGSESEFYEKQNDVKQTLTKAINQLRILTAHIQFNDLKETYQDRIFDAMKKLNQIKNNL